LFNAVWSSWACLAAYAFEQDVNDQYIYKYPKVYTAGQLNVYFNQKVFWRWITMSLWHGVTTYYGTVYGLSGPIDSTGRTYSHWFTSCIAFSLVMHTIVFKLFIETSYWNTLTICVNIFCGLLFYYLTVVIGSMPGIGEIF